MVVSENPAHAKARFGCAFRGLVVPVVTEVPELSMGADADKSTTAVPIPLKSCAVATSRQFDELLPALFTYARVILVFPRG